MDFTKKKSQKTSAKARLISYYNRHHSNSPILTSRPGTSLESIQSTASTQNTKKLSILSKSSASKNQELQSNELKNLSKDSSSSLPDLTQTYSDTESYKDYLQKKEQELKAKEQFLIEKEQKLNEGQKDLNKLALKLMSKEKDLAKEEESLKLRKSQVLSEVNKELEGKFQELKLQKQGLERLLLTLAEKMGEINTRREEGYFFAESESDSGFDSRVELENIEEFSQESSECGSFEYSKQKNSIMASCKELSQENTDISSKIDEILASFSYQPRY